MLASHDSHLLSEGVARVYGHSYPTPDFYDPVYLRDAISCGKLHCVVVTNSCDEVVGCMSTVLEARGDFTADGRSIAGRVSSHD